MIIKSDWHMHSEFSHDSKLPLQEIVDKGREGGFIKLGVSDHVNLNDERFLGNLKRSAENVLEMKKKYPELMLGAEFNPIAKPHFDYIAKHGNDEGYIPPAEGHYAIELAATKEELVALGVQYGIGAAHWRMDTPDVNAPGTLDEVIKDWYRQQMFLANDERVTILGHPWWHSGDFEWYHDFSVIPHSMNMDIAAALKENGKYVECNSGILNPPYYCDKFKYQYAEFLRELFEMGIPVTYGSDCHNRYTDPRENMERYLRAAGFKPGDFSEIAEKDLWNK